MSRLENMASLYIVGAQCTGKTTLLEALTAKLILLRQEQEVDFIRETAREILQLHAFNRDDIRSGGDRCILLQRLILEAQHARESTRKKGTIFVADRSGLDPLVYATMYGPEESTKELLQTVAWRQCRTNLQSAAVVVCEPVEEWLFDDGTRLMPHDLDEWLLLHKTFCDMLEEHNIQYTVLPARMKDITSRISFIVDVWISQLLRDSHAYPAKQRLIASLQG